MSRVFRSFEMQDKINWRKLSNDGIMVKKIFEAVSIHFRADERGEKAMLSSTV
jgi:hypothetical protein